MNLIKSLKLNFKQYILMNVYIIILTFIMIIVFYFFNQILFENKFIISIFFIIIIAITFSFPSLKNYIYYGILFITNTLTNISIFL